MLKLLNKIFQIFTDILVFIVTILILFSLYNLISIKVLNKPYASLMGYSMFEIATGSMEPTINVKDLILVKITKDIKLNDIVTYEEDNNLITHRVIDIKDDYIITKGDANNSKDVNVSKNKIVGKTIYIIRKGGIIREIFITPKIIISIVITLFLVNYCFSLPACDNKQKKLKNNKQKKQDKKNRKIKKIDNENTSKENEIVFNNIFKLVKINEENNIKENEDSSLKKNSKKEKTIISNSKCSFQDIRNNIDSSDK